MKVREREPASLKETLILAMKLEVLYQSSRMEKESQKVHVRAAQQDKKVKDRDKSPARGRRTVESSVASKDDSLRDDVSTYLRLERQDREIQELRDQVRRLLQITTARPDRHMETRRQRRYDQGLGQSHRPDSTKDSTISQHRVLTEPPG